MSTFVSRPKFSIDVFDDGNDRYMSEPNLWYKVHNDRLPPGKVSLVNVKTGTTIRSISEWKVVEPHGHTFANGATYMITTFDDGNERFAAAPNVWRPAMDTSLPPGKMKLVNDVTGDVIRSISEWKTHRIHF